MAKKVLENTGGQDNVTDYENCMIRLRLVIDDLSPVNEDKIKQADAHGVVKVDDHHVQVIDGPQANSDMNEFRK